MRFEEHLSLEYGHDYWSDEAVLIAGRMLGEFRSEDWDELSQSWPTQTTLWKERCADALDMEPSERAFSILLSMACDPDEIVSLAALDSLRSFPDSQEVSDIRRQKQIRPSSP